MIDRSDGSFLVLVAVGLAVLTAACGSSSEQPPLDMPAETDFPGESDRALLLADTRSSLSICVDRPEGPGVSAADVDAVETALVTGFATQEQIPDEFQQHVIRSGCPATTEVLGSRIVFPGLYAPHINDDASPSEHRLWVYFVDAETYDATFDKPGYTATAAEFKCGGDFCLEVTNALFVSSSASEEELIRAVLEVLRLIPQERPAEPILDWSACDRGGQPHPDYTCDDLWKLDEDTPQ